MTSQGLPRCAWMREDHAMLAEQAGRFFEQEVVPHYDRFERDGMFDRDVWEKAGATGLLAPSAPEEFGGAGGDFGHDAVIIEAAGSTGCDGFGGALHSAIVMPRSEISFSTSSMDCPCWPAIFAISSMI